ncbi:VanW family protein [Proteinivorax hydrogeniformans]|uniref:VanW family protein n=1 Tax=Proteinivorax hydrogeniformans TaxID=1826727 RepID=A0AAU8HX87_9FIRM
MLNYIKTRPLTFFLLSTLVILISGSSIHTAFYRNNYLPGTYINNIYVGKMSVEDSLEMVSEKYSQKDYITIKLKEQSWDIPFDSLYSLQTDTLNNALVEIKDKQRTLSPIRFINLLLTHQKEDVVYELNPVNLDTLDDELNKVAKEISVKPINASIYIEDKKIKTTVHKKGVKLNNSKTAEEIITNLQSGKVVTEVIIEEIPPEITEDMLSALKITDKVSSVSSSYANSADNRIYNVKKAGNKVKNHLLWPGETFSFNDVVGEANKENGYKESTIIINNQFVPGYGGGVCQVSSNLYNAALKANLKIVERHKHGRPVSYFDVGWDATIAYPYLDLKFKNNTPFGILIDIDYTDTEISTYIYSFPPAFPKVELTQTDFKEVDYKVEYVENSDITKGKKIIKSEGKKGYKVTTWRNIHLSDGTVYKEKLFEDFYKPVSKIVEKHPIDIR